MKNKKTKIISAGLAIMMLISTSFSPAAHAATKQTTESGVKIALYASALYDCVQNYVVLNETTAVGNDISTILSSPQYYQTYVGEWIGNAEGKISCKDAIEKLSVGGKIVSGYLDPGKLLGGVYEQVTESLQKIKCNYGIINSSDNAFMDGTYSWPQGYVNDGNDPPKDYRSHGVVEVVFNDEGPVRFEGATSDMDTGRALEALKNIIMDWTDIGHICWNVVKYTPVYPMPSQDINGNSITMYEPVMATTDPTPFNEWGLHADDRYHAWVYGRAENTKFSHTLSAASKTTQLKLKEGGREKFLENISRIYLNNKTNMTDYLSTDPDAKYILYGRYLFNGDSKGAFACAGTSVATDDPNFTELTKTDYWDTTQPYIAVTKAYKDGSASSKSEFRTKFGGNGIASPGAAKSIYLPGVSGDCKELASTFNSVNPTTTTAKTTVATYLGVSDISALPAVAPTDPSAAGDSTAAATETICAQAAGALSWIVCPVLQKVGESVADIYEMIEKSFLQVDVDYMARGGPTYKTWQKFQFYANIVFTIILLVVILSQITGFGINNYGVKKILPALIMVSVLVNISFFLCQVAVDISNILGYELRQKLLEFSGEITLEVTEFGNGGAGSVVSFIITSIMGVGASVALFANFGAWIWPFLVSLLGVAIGVLFFFLLLGLRQVGIIVLVVMAPVAIVCYALPNTKSFFDRWRKMLTALLVVYPVCGLMMGGGQFVSKLMLSNIAADAVKSAASTSGGNIVAMASTLFGATGGIADFFYVIVALGVQIVPFFFIPSLVRSSMAAMGNIGSKLSSLGNSLSKSSTGAIRRSEGYKDRVDRGKAWDAKRQVDPWYKKDNKFAKIAGAPRRGISKAGAWVRSRNNVVSRAMDKSYNQKQAKLRGIVEERAIKDDKFKYAASGDFNQHLENRRNAEQEKYIKGLADDIESANTDIASDDEKLGELHAEALAELNKDPQSNEKRATVRAYQNMLNANGDVGRKRLFNNFAEDLNNNNGVVNDGTKMAAQHLMRDHAKDIKPNNRDLFSMLADASSGKLATDNDNNVIPKFTSVNKGTAEKPDIQWRSSYYGNNSVGGYDAASFARADESAINRLIDQAEAGELNNNQKEQLEEYTRHALDGQHNIHVQGKVANKMNELRRQMGYDEIAAGTSGATVQAGGTTDSGSIPVPHSVPAQTAAPTTPPPDARRFP